MPVLVSNFELNMNNKKNCFALLFNSSGSVLELSLYKAKIAVNVDFYKYAGKPGQEPFFIFSFLLD